MKRLGRRHPVLLGALVIAGAVTLAFLVNLGIVLFNDMREPDRPVEGWMTPRYLIRVYDLQPDDLARVLDVVPGSLPGVPLKRIARERGLPLPDLIVAIEALRAQVEP
ncbi:MAG: hypothetical protein Q7J57_13635 [Gemmobacter sp.]|nr:hypothetical protein [Gemmobacter sp.]